MKRLLVTLAILVLCAISVIGCAKQAPALAPTPKATPQATPKVATTSPTASKPVAPQPQYGGVLKIITSSVPVNMGCLGDPYTPGDIERGAPSVETLIRLDEKGLPTVPCLATAWQYSSDFKSLTLTLRKGVKFHDDTDFNAEAVKYVLDAVRPTAAELSSVKSIDIVDDYTVRLNLSEFQGHLLLGLAGGPGRIMSPTAAKTQTKEWLYNHPVGTGPFKVTDFKRDVSLTFKKFDGYWQKGKPYLDQIQWIFIADKTVCLMSFKQGDAQVMPGLLPEDAANLQKTGKYNVDYTWNQINGLAGDSAHPGSPFANVKVRQAVAYAIDREAINKALGYGYWKSVNQPSAPGSWAYNPAVAGYSYNPLKAKQLLSEAGYPGGFKTKIIFSIFNQKDEVNAIQSYLAEVGINAETQILLAAPFNQARSGWDQSLISHSIPVGGGADIGQSLLSRLSSKGLYKSISYPADYEAKLSQVLSESDQNKRQELVQGLMKMITDEYCMVMAPYCSVLIAAKTPEVHDMKYYEYWTNQWTPEDVWLSK